jgi:outer membrane receptor protein involved in Fe transport
MTYIADTVDSTRVRGNVGRPLLPIAPILPNDGDYSQFGVFLTDTWQATDWLSLHAGVRYSNLNADGTVRRNNQNIFFDESFDVWVSEFGANVRLTENINWFANIAEGFRSPNLDDLGSEDVASSAGPDFGTTSLNTERVWNYETGFKSQFQSFQGYASVYQGNYNNLIARDTRGGRNIRANFEGVIRGAEYDANLFLTETWTLFGNMTYVWGENTDLNEPIRVPPVFFISGSRLAFPRYRSFVELWGEFSGKQTRLGAIDRADIRVPLGGERAWQTFNIRGGTDFGRWGQVSLGVYNVFDQAYRVLGSGINAPGVDFRVGYSLSF